MGLLSNENCTKVDVYSASTETTMDVAVIPSDISAGFPSPALDFTDISIDLNKHLIKHPSATFYGRVKGESMKDAGINDGDLLVIDKSIELQNGKIAVCYLDGEFTLKRIKLDKKGIWLMPENSDYKPIKMEENNTLLVWGIVTHVIKKV
ncbi:MAG: translesion error-prone DNA polymerase V autoproteolytic subunit [Bacteroidales bacterium]|jgi:DNA polymerase V|nr:translesion error-prone DNA polymerase V autoproteolytic subunit [Bacteroidales bacterium]